MHDSAIGKDQVGGADNHADVFLENLYRRHWQALHAYIRKTFGAGPPDPDDIVQEAFIRLAGRDDLASVANPKAFLMLTARNLAIDARRRRVRSDTVLRSLAVLTESDRESDASNVLSSREELERLAAVVQTLKPKDRAALLMHRLDGLSFAEIGRRMGISPSGARLLVDRALAICVARMRT